MQAYPQRCVHIEMSTAINQSQNLSVFVCSVSQPINLKGASQLVCSQKKQVETIKEPPGEVLSPELVLLSVHLFLQKAPSEPKGRSYRTPTCCSTFPLALNARLGFTVSECPEEEEEEEESLTPASQPLNMSTLTTADRGRQINCIYIFIHKSDRVRLLKLTSFLRVCPFLCVKDTRFPYFYRSRVRFKTFHTDAISHESN